MISGGNATVYVSDIDAAIRFYTGSLGLKLTNRFGRRWATIDAGPSYWTSDEAGAGLVIGLHPQSPGHPAPGNNGAVGFGFETYAPIERVIETLAQRAVRMTGEVIKFEGGNTASFEDRDGTQTYLHEFPPEMVGEAGSSEGQDLKPATLSGGHAIVYVNDMDTAIRFYVDVLGLNLTNRYGDKIATVEAGQSFVVALHPRTVRSPIPGAKGSVTLGFTIDEPIETVLPRLAKRGVRLAAEPVSSELGRMAETEDPDGNSIYLWEDEARLLLPADLVSSGSMVR